MKSLIFSLIGLCCWAGLKAQTQPVIAKDDKAFRFFIIGDWGRNGEHNQQTVADQMGKLGDTFDPEFVLNTGDNFYCCGVASTEDPQWMASFENIYKAHSLNIPWYSVLGNHDYHGNPQAEIDYSRKSQRWKMPDRYYTFVENGVRFVFVDTSPFLKNYQKHASAYADIAKQDTRRQLAWLDSVLANSKETWKIVIGHHPVYSTGKHGNTQELIDELKPRLEKYGVQVYFCGHDHDLQYQKPAGSPVNYLVSGAGSEHRPNKPDPAMTRFAQSTSGFMAASLRDDSLHISVIDYEGKLIYSTDIPKAVK
jgi:tartrate-resistant acid phosphatase type 5